MADQHRALESALGELPWSVSGVVAGIDHIRDDHGRPIGERRAPAESRRDLPIELVPCPYHDERKGRLMNRAALEPMMRQFAAVLAEVTAFYAALPPAPPSWPRMLTAVLDQLSAPARFLLEHRRSDGPVPSISSAGHKLAAGYYGTLRGLLRLHLAGIAAAPEVSAESFTAFVHQHGSLIGASEVCAGPIHHIHQLTQRFVHGAPAEPERRLAAPPTPLRRERVELAVVLAEQVQLGVVWEVLDEHTERALLLAGAAPRPLKPRTAYLRDRLASRAVELLQRAAPRPAALASSPAAAAHPALAAVLAAPDAPPASEQEVEQLRALLAFGDGAILLSEPELDEHARLFAGVLRRHRLFVEAQWRLELRLRGALGYPAGAGFQLNPMLIPRPRTLEWFEVFTGHRLQWSAELASQSSKLAARNLRRVEPLFELAAPLGS